MQAPRDENRVPTLLGVSSIDNTTTTTVAVDPTTHGMIIDGTSLFADLDPRYVNVSGDTMSGDLNMGNNDITSVGSLSFDNLYTNTGTEPAGSIYYNTVDGTLDLKLNNATLQIGQEIYFYGKASGAIANGDLCQFAGVQGNHILMKKVVPAEVIASPHYLIGIATQAITNGNFGYVTWFGKVNDIYTKTPANNDSVDWVAGDILYFDNVTGQLTKIAPVAPQRRIIIAAVIKAQTGASENGIIIVRPTFGQKLEDIDDVDGTAPTVTGQLLSWNQTNLRWERSAYNITDYVLNSTLATEHTDTLGPQGWIPEQDWNKAAVAIVTTTKLQLVISSPTNIAYYWRGNKTDLGTTTLTVTSTIDKAEGIWYCYSTDGTNFVLNQTPFYIYDNISGSMRADLMVWEFYWDNTNNTTLWIKPEFHSNQLSSGNHGYLHEAFGTRYSNGLDITYGTTANNADTRVKLTSGEIHDEDISCYIVHSATPTTIWEQILGSAGTADENYAALPIYYLSGATPVWRKTTTSSYPFLPVSNNYIYYNRNNAGTWDYTTSIGSTSFVVYWVVGTTNQSEPVIIIPGRQDNANLTAAQAETFPVLSGLLTEFKLLYRIIYQTSAANSNNGKCKINSVADYRRDAISNNSSATSTPSAALVSFTPTATILATNVQAAIEEVVTDADATYLKLDASNDPITGDLLVKPTSNSTTTFQIQPSGSTTPVIDIDTTNSRVGILTATPSNTLSLASEATRTIQVERRTTANTLGSILVIQAGGATLGATDKAGGGLHLNAGISTGTGISQILLKTYTPAASTATTDNTLVTRAIINHIGLAVSGQLVIDSTNATSGSDYIGTEVNTIQSVATANTTYAYRAKVTATHTSGTIAGVQSNSTQADFTGSGGTTTYAEVLTSNASVTNNAIVDNLSLIRTYTPTINTGGSVGILNGIFLDNVTGGTTNYSIYSAGGDMYHAGNAVFGGTLGASNLAITAGKVLTVSNTLTLAGTDSTTMTFPATSTTLVGIDTTDTLTNKTLTSPKINENVVLTSTSTKLNYLTSATGTTGTNSTNIVFSTSPTIATPTFTTSITISAGSIITDVTTGLKIGTATTQKIGFFNSTPIVKGTAFTQTYATASHTHAAITSLAAPAGGTGTAAGGYDTAANRNLMITSHNAMRTDIANVKNTLNGLIDDLQALGLIA